MSKHGIPHGAEAIPSRARSKHVIQHEDQDPYRDHAKPAEPAVCSDCSAVFHAGRWQWLPAPVRATTTLCPACHRIRDRLPAGYIRLGGEFFAENRAEVLRLMQHVADRAKQEHPLDRVMDMTDERDELLVTTTDIHLARGIGEALHHAYRGTLELRYSDDETLLRVHWRR